MSLIASLLSGYDAGEWGSAPIYPGAVWNQVIKLGVPDVTGLEFDIYARDNPRSSSRLFSVGHTLGTDADNNRTLVAKSPNAQTNEAFLNPKIWVTCEVRDSADTYILIDGWVECGVGSLPAEEGA